MLVEQVLAADDYLVPASAGFGPPRALARRPCRASLRIKGSITWPRTVGTPVEGQNTANARAARACGGSAAAGLAGAWGPISYSNCNVWGSPGWTQGYAWNAMDPARSVCVQGRGFKLSGVGTWYAIGCGSSGIVDVSWGNILATPQVRAISDAVLLGNTVSWRH